MTAPEIDTRGWYKSSYSAQANECVESRLTASGGMAIRDSKDPQGPALVFPAGSWQAFVSTLRTPDVL
ncbi:DUF397 domain-containing protein [Kitasatospora sp. RB6PN24]|uniref:DUF397 domain-containing protein n=1 Tax=Kitasatospora humi TaxID=2893891 RepID=UPI001E408D5F|nr:DUF397 domain-containing protein [Kitasatospora humi]MCC9309014.1 DUF397 domain-containing protein [Kitasatospora humi]